jgi:hypothetical protein
MRKIVQCRFGSHLYGTNTPLSDIDIKSVYIPSADDIVLQKVKGSISVKRNKLIGEKNFAGEIDEEIYSLQKFFQLVSEGQTVALDLLFSNSESWISHTPEWLEIIANRHRLITRKSEAFIGYCRQQAKKYGIKGSRVAAAREVLNYLKSCSNEYLGLNSKLIRWSNSIDEFVSLSSNKEFINIVEIEQNSGTKTTFLDVCGRKLSYTASLKNAIEVVQRLVDEYGQRALQAESNQGIDWKSLSHAVRIGQQAVELFQTKNITFPRPNADFLLKIKKGELPYVQVAEIIENLFEEVEEAARNSDFPEDVDKEWIVKFVYSKYMASITYFSIDLSANTITWV